MKKKIIKVILFFKFFLVERYCKFVMYIDWRRDLYFFIFILIKKDVIILKSKIKILFKNVSFIIKKKFCY